ncbi:MAG: hypothetical protein Q4G03_02775 [Planctomycetia bacterium]|nr:hypothetical protein [Planctomycetia bacterium]
MTSRRLFITQGVTTLIASSQEEALTSERSASDDWLVKRVSDARYETLSLGRVRYAHAHEAQIEPRVAQSPTQISLVPGDAIVLRPPVEPETAEELCQSVMTWRGRQDHVWLRNGDEFSGTFLYLDIRFVSFQAFGVVVKTPRYLTRAIRLGLERSARL